MFLSFHEDEMCQVIRLEGKRKNILFPNQAILYIDCAGFEDALDKCRSIRDFIDPALKINYIRRARGKKNRNFDKWEYLE